MTKRLAALAVLILGALAFLVVPGSATNSGLAWCNTHSGFAVLGDSLSTGYSTYGYTATNNQYQYTSNGWTSIVSQNYAAWYGTTMYNYSHGGAQTGDYLGTDPAGGWAVTTGAVADIATHQPTLIGIALGINDQAAGETPAQFGTNIATLVNNIRAVDPQSAIFLVDEPEADFNAATGQHNPVYPWSQYQAALVHDAQTLNTGYLDDDYTMPTIPTDLALPAAQQSGLYSSSTGHPNNAGNRTQAALWMNALFGVC